MDDRDYIIDIALEMIKRFSADAARIARERAEISATVPDLFSAETWHDIADAIDRLSPKP